MQNVFPDDWKPTGSPLSKTIGFSALMKLLPYLFNKGRVENKFTQEIFERELSKAKNLAPFTFEKYPANAGGEGKLYRDLLAQISESESTAVVTE